MREDGSKVELTLTKEATFIWKFSMKESAQEFSGKYKVATYKTRATPPRRILIFPAG